MKSWGLNPTNNEVQDIMNDIDDSGDGEFDFPEFIEIMANRMKVNRNDTYDCGWANMNVPNEWSWYLSDIGWAYLNGAPNNLKMILIEQTRMNYDCNWARFRLPMIWNWYYIKRKATLKLNWFWLSKPWWCSQ